MANKNTNDGQVSLPSPSEFKEYLDQYVCGQDDAKRILSVAVYNHYKRIIYNNNPNRKFNIDKSNILLLGGTGTGKTLLVKTIAEMLGVPCYIQDCTKITESGYVGSDVEDCLVGLLRACNYDVERAENGIVMLDEGDKIAKKGAGVSLTRDVSGEGVQQSLLKIVEGDLVGVPPAGGRKHPEQPLIYVDTSNILFILSGAFDGIEKIVEDRIGRGRIGFSSDNVVYDMIHDEDSMNSLVTPQDLKDFGLIPEFVGRFPVIAHTNKLTEDDLISILNTPKNAIIKQFEELLGMDKTELKFEDGALRYIAKIAIELGTGARGLRTIIEDILSDIMYNAPDDAKNVKRKHNKILITEDIAKERIEKKYKNVMLLKRSA
ncbi:MAG: ATP-dependent Clp protease ATP-binding subunit ClpX [Bacteroidales bacterium]|nr:ATP-dependent Clp protease ATP-binding subunit ClpX [Bacteroidales bacterium]